MAEKCTKTSSPDWRLMKPKPLASLNHFTVPCSIVLPVSILNFCLEESLRVIRVSLVGGTDSQLLGESNLADIYWMCEARKTIHSEQRTNRPHPNTTETTEEPTM